MYLMSYVLIVDDDPDARELLEDIAQSLGFETCSASDGIEALGLLSHIGREVPRLILLDLMMPMMDGFAVYNWLRGNPLTRRVPVIVVTAVAHNQLDMLRLPGVSKVIQKGQFSTSQMSELMQSVAMPSGSAATRSHT
jgi:CheY-like chemotaxis protein